MTREEARKLLPIIEAYSKGKTIQIWDESKSKWFDLDVAAFGAYPDKYRIKPEPKYRPFKNQEECWNEMSKHQSFGWLKNKCGNIFNIIAIFKESIKLNECDTHYSVLCKEFKFMDGTPFGIKED